MQSFTLETALCLPQMCHSPPHEPVDTYDRQHDTNPFASVSGTVPILLQYGLAVNLALGSQCALIHTLAPFAAVVNPVSELIDHHASENVRLLGWVSVSLSRRRERWLT